MSYTVNGSTWTPQTTIQHANNMLATLNATLLSLSLPTLTPSYSNIIWLILLAVGAIAAVFDQALSAAKNSFNIASCDDAQILNLLPIAGTSLIPGSYSTLNVIVTATSGGTLTVPSGSHVIVSGISNRFLTQSTITVPAGTSVTTPTVCDTIGAISVVSGQVSGFVESFSNFGSVINTVPAVLGSPQETVAQVRTRLLNGNTLSNNINGLITALKELPGVINAAAYFNISPTLTLTLSGVITLNPRTVYMVVNGSSSLIASTYASLMNAPTQGTMLQNFVTLAGQNIPIYYDQAVLGYVWVKVYVNQNYTQKQGFQYQIQAAITSLANLVQIGQPITAEFVSQAFNNFVYCTINGVAVSSDGINYSRVVNMAANAVPTFSGSYVSIVLE